MATPITGLSRVSAALVSRQSADISSAQPETTAAAAVPHTAAAHSKATRHDHAHAGAPTTGVPRDSLALPALNAASYPEVASARLHAAKEMLHTTGFSDPAAQAFFEREVTRLMEKEPQKLESWLAGVILAASHKQSASPAAPAIGLLTPGDALTVLAQQPCMTDEQRVKLAAWVTLPEAELQQRLAESSASSSASSSRPAA